MSKLLKIINTCEVALKKILKVFSSNERAYLFWTSHHNFLIGLIVVTHVLLTALCESWLLPKPDLGLDSRPSSPNVSVICTDSNTCAGGTCCWALKHPHRTRINTPGKSAQGQDLFATQTAGSVQTRNCCISGFRSFMLVSLEMLCGWFVSELQNTWRKIMRHGIYHEKTNTWAHT